ncbi:MAG: endonuclease/exonuclease/phosphatase family protein [Bdellovibrionota bacterium]
MKRITSLFLPASVAVVLLLTIAGFCGKLSFELDLLSHFRSQYALAGLICAVAAGLSRRPYVLIAGLACLLVNGVQLAPFLSIRGAAARGNAESKRIIFANVDIRNRQFDRLVTLSGALAPDVAVFTEVDAEWAQHLSALTERLPHVLSEPRADKFGMMLLSHVPILKQNVIELPGVLIPSVIFDVTVSEPEGPLRVIAAHSPAPVNQPGYDNRNKMLKRISDMIPESDLPTVVVGDLNITPWSPVFSEFLSTSSLQNARAGRGILPTWPRNVLPLMIPIDHCLTTPSIRIEDMTTTPEFGSDHLGVVCDIEQTEIAPHE